MNCSGALIVNVGMMTAVGVGAPQTSTSVRASIARFKESEFYNQHGEPMILALLPDNVLPPLDPALEARDLSAHQRRLLQLAMPALQETLQGIPHPHNVPLFLGVPETGPGQTPVVPPAFLAVLAHHSSVTFNLAASRMFPNGRAAGLLALRAAVEHVNSGAAQYALAGGVDSYFDRDLLEALDEEDRVKAEGVMDCFIPGEGAGFLLVCAEPGAVPAHLPPLARITGVEIGAELGHLYSSEPYRGDGLAHTVQGVLTAAATPAGQIKTVVAGYNGEHLWHKEWGVAYLRNQDKFARPHDFEHPADCFGDPGAALGLLLVGLAATGIQKGYVTPDCLVWCSSDRGERGAVILTAV